MITRAAAHEVGHAMACVKLDIPLVSATLDPPRIRRGTYKAAQPFASMAMAAMLCSGMEAERLLHGDVPESACATDTARAREILSGFFGEANADLHLGRAKQAAQEMVSTHRRDIETIAAALQEAGELSGERIRRLLAPPELTAKQVCAAARVGFEAAYDAMPIAEVRRLVTLQRAKADEALSIQSQRVDELGPPDPRLQPYGARLAALPLPLSTRRALAEAGRAMWKKVY